MAKTATRKKQAEKAPEPVQKAEGQYEAMFLLGPSATAEPEGALNLCRGMIERHHGKMILIKKWDERKLAYEVNGQKRGTYIIAYFTAPGDAVGPIERDVKLNEQVLRVMVTKADHLNKDEMAAVEPQPIQPREERNPWDRPAWNDRPPREDRPREDRPASDRAPRAPRESAPAGKE